MMRTINTIIAFGMVLGLASCGTDPEPCFPHGPLGDDPSSVWPCDMSDEQLMAYGDLVDGVRIPHQTCFSEAECPLDCEEVDLLQTVKEDFIATHQGNPGPVLMEGDIIDESALCFEAEEDSDCCYSAVFVFPNTGGRP
jgi:hypothetical protein